MREYYYIAGTDVAVRKSGKVRQQPVFDGPHRTEEEAHDVARRIIVAGHYEILAFPTASRETARQMYNHQLAMQVGAGSAVVNKARLIPKRERVDDKTIMRNEAWGKE